MWTDYAGSRASELHTELNKNIYSRLTLHQVTYKALRLLEKRLLALPCFISIHQFS